jgi:hypothetical protein
MPTNWNGLVTRGSSESDTKQGGNPDTKKGNPDAIWLDMHQKALTTRQVPHDAYSGS